jgi:hypothetical protein
MAKTKLNDINDCSYNAENLGVVKVLLLFTLDDRGDLMSPYFNRLKDPRMVCQSPNPLKIMLRKWSV